MLIEIGSDNRVLECFEVGVSPEIPASAKELTASEEALIRNAVCFGDFLYLNGKLTFSPLLITERANKAAEIRQACQAEIVSGFVSNALGLPYTYPSSLIDQQNLAANVLSSTLPAAQVADWATMQICADQSTPPVWAYRPHTQQQIQQVGDDGKNATMTCLLKNDTLQKLIVDAATQADLDAVVWK